MSQPITVTYPKCHFSVFDGENPRIWINKCKEYFKLYNIADHMMTSATSLHLEGNAAKWYQV